MSDLVGNPEDRFSCVAARMILLLSKSEISGIYHLAWFVLNLLGNPGDIFQLYPRLPAWWRSRENLFFFNSVLRIFQDYFSSYETGQSVGGRKQENPEKNPLAHPQAELGLSHMWPVRGSNPHQTVVR